MSSGASDNVPISITVLEDDRQRNPPERPGAGHRSRARRRGRLLSEPTNPGQRLPIAPVGPPPWVRCRPARRRMFTALYGKPVRCRDPGERTLHHPPMSSLRLVRSRTVAIMALAAFAVLDRSPRPADAAAAAKGHHGSSDQAQPRIIVALPGREHHVEHGHARAQHDERHHHRHHHAADEHHGGRAQLDHHRRADDHCGGHGRANRSDRAHRPDRTLGRRRRTAAVADRNPRPPPAPRGAPAHPRAPAPSTGRRPRPAVARWRRRRRSSEAANPLNGVLPGGSRRCPDRAPTCRASSSRASTSRSSCCRSTRRRPATTASPGRCSPPSTRSRPTTATI